MVGGETLSQSLNEMVRQSVKESVELNHAALRGLPLYNGREIKYCIAPTTEEKLSIEEIMQFMYLQLSSVMNSKTHSPYYKSGYSEAIELLHMYIDKRIEEDLQKINEIDANCY